MTKTISWDDDKIGGRKEAAGYLTKFMCDAYARNKKDEAFVVSLNAPWGFGKTFFLERWAEDLKDSGHPVVHFDAWKTDFSNQPLLTFIVEFYSQLLEQLKDVSRTKITFEIQMERISEAVLPILKDALKRFTSMDLEQLNFGGLLKEYETKLSGVEEFRKQIDALCKLFSKNDKEPPIFVFVDEMDRCRPNYAIELLESIKHVFSSKNLCFIVATDTAQLSESIKAVYGSGFDADRYLHRFFSQEYRLPEPDNERFASYLFETIPIDPGKLFNPSQESNQRVFARLANLHDLSIREQIKAYELLLALVVSNDNNAIDIVFALALIMLKLASAENYDRLTKMPYTHHRSSEIYGSGKYNPRVYLRDIRIESDYSGRNDNIQIVQIIEYFMRYMGRDLSNQGKGFPSNPSHQIYQNIDNRMFGQVIRDGLVEEVQYGDIHYYPDRIRKIGHLIES